jgi:selenide,water dikinase
MTPRGPTRDLVLVGGGHAHAQVLASLARRPAMGARVTVVVDDPVAVYSGMVPGVVSGRYAPSDVEIDVRPLARRAGAVLIVDPVVGVDPGERRLHLRGRPPLRYDVASLDVGAGVRDVDLPGVATHAVPTRPIARLVERVAGAVAPLGVDDAIVVVGGGAAGVELAFSVQARTGSRRLTLVDPGQDPPSGLGGAAARRVRQAAHARGVALLGGRRVVAVEADAVRLDDGTRLPASLVLWATGAAPHSWLATSGLPTDTRGFVRVDAALEVIGHRGLFAAGDCAVPDGHPALPRSGVHAVRQGPVLTRNLRAALDDRPRSPWRPQRDTLALLHLGDGTAIATKWGLSARCRALDTWKDRIDRAFVERFRALDPEGRPLPTLPPPPDDAMSCAGCAAKVDFRTLDVALSAAGHPPGDDAARLPGPGGPLAWTIDVFPAFDEDPWLVGRIAARHALRDLWAKGARPTGALAVVSVPDGPLAADVVARVTAGLAAALAEEGVALLGGHTGTSDTLRVGLTALGDAPRFVGLDGGRPGDALLLTGALGVGVALRADRRGLLGGRAASRVLAAMDRSDAAFLDLLDDLHADVRAATDVSGFGLVGHLLALCRASGCGAELDGDALPALPVDAALAAGVRSSADGPNRASYQEFVDAPPGWGREPLLYDPATGGGLLVAVSPDAAERVAAAIGAVRIGRLGVGPPRVAVRVSRATITS